jgi:hypothetical protein
MHAHEFDSALESLRVALGRAIDDVAGLVPGWRQSVRVVALTAEHASRAASRAGSTDAADRFARVAERARETGGLAGAEALERMRDVAGEVAKIAGSSGPA